jgi:F0F1-type ATP synthase delta subunit
MKVARHTLAKVIADRLTAADEQQLAREAAAYLITERRAGELSSLVRDMEQLRADQDGVVELTAVSAHQLSPTVINDIKAKIRQAYPAAKDFIINEQLDENVVGGVRLELANQQLDLSVRNKLNVFKQLTTQGDK